MKTTRTYALAVLSVVSLLLSACDDGSRKSSTAPPVPPSPEVSAVTVAPRTVMLERVYPARAQAAAYVDVRARVEGILLERNYEEGSRVEAGAVLFRIDPAPYEARVQQAEAELDRARAQAREAQRQWKRVSELFQKNAVSERQRDEAQAALELAQAGVANAQAMLRTARINLGYTKVTAPISGVTGLRAVSNGNLVTAGALLTTIRQLDPIHVLFSMPEADAIAQRRQMNAIGPTPAADQRLTARVQQTDGSVYEQQGVIDFLGASVDPQTATVQARAVFPNPQGVLTPGQFLRISVQGLKLVDVIVVPAKAVAEGPQGPIVYVVNEQSVAQPQPVTLGQNVERGGQVIAEGLQAGERVIIGGIPSVRPGQPVRPVPPAETASDQDREAAAHAGKKPEAGR